jgi:hypothetical protein
MCRADLVGVIVALADVWPASIAFLCSRPARVHHPRRVMITASAASTFEGDKWSEMERVQPENERLAN